METKVTKEVWNRLSDKASIHHAYVEGIYMTPGGVKVALLITQGEQDDEALYQWLPYEMWEEEWNPELLPFAYVSDFPLAELKGHVTYDYLVRRGKELHPDVDFYNMRVAEIHEMDMKKYKEKGLGTLMLQQIIKRMSFQNAMYKYEIEEPFPYISLIGKMVMEEGEQYDDLSQFYAKNGFSLVSPYAYKVIEEKMSWLDYIDLI